MEKQNVFYLGVDIGKYHHQATLIDERRNQIGESLRFDNCLTGFKFLTQTIKQRLPENAIVEIGMEATGHYYWHLRNHLVDIGFGSLQVINPIETQKLSKTRIRKVKNDKVDSLIIAQLISQRANNHPVVKENIELRQLKDLTRFCEKQKAQKRFYQQELSVLMERLSPEFSACFSNIFLATPLMIIKKHFLGNIKGDLLAQAMIKTSRGRLSETKAKEIVCILKNSLGKEYRCGNAKLQLKMLLESMGLIDKQIKEIKKQIEKNSLQFEEIKYLSSIKGVSNYLASVILCEIGNINRFSNKGQLTAFAGLDASVKESGEYRRTQGNHISKRGSKHLRRQLYYAAKTAIIFDPELKAYYQKKKEQGKHYNVIIIAVARKILMRCYAVLKQKRPYELRNS